MVEREELSNENSILNLNRSNISDSAKIRINNKYSENMSKFRNGEHIKYSN